MNTLVPQKYLRNRGFTAFIVFMNMFIPLSTDMYLPALPTMSTYFQTSTANINLTMTAFFLFYAIGILFWGPLSDKYGRRPILCLGAGLYMLSSFACALCQDIGMLIAVRVVQGFASGAIISVSIAIVKDAYSGRMRERILAFIQTAAGLAPMIAPLAGAFLLTFADWRASFVVLGIVGAACLVLVLLFQETLAKADRTSGGLGQAMLRLVAVGKNKGLTIPTLIFAVTNFCFMAYIVLSSYIFVDFFGLSESAYSYYFAANALLSMAAPLLYVRFFSHYRRRTFTFVFFGMQLLSGLLMVSVGGLSPLLFLLSFLPYSYAGTASRTFSTNFLLDQQSGDTGSASSLINFSWTLAGCIGMVVLSGSSANLVLSLGLCIVIISALQILAWWGLLHSKVRCKGITYDEGLLAKAKA